MKRIMLPLLCCLLLTACRQNTHTDTPIPSASVLPTQTTTATASTEEATEPPVHTFRLYYGDENAENFLSKEVEVPEINENTVLKALITAGVLPEDVTINTFAAAGSQLNIDFNDAFLAHLNSMGTAGERMVTGSVVNTFLSAYDAQTVFLTVDGEIMETGHVIYDFPIEFTH